LEISLRVEEDKTEKPFVGRAGKFLSELLKIARIQRKKFLPLLP